ncbi:NAD(P)-dependent oxidoreductase [Roseomonas marmotae]|uniref:NAD(P)-dependent oxidoreductase n=1 Tax=Roseomonas marmotae TaxID=2768161 RepID=A0ABS3KEC0_9PROT|nr:NAD(P)-dependent oxidoreductase [Roseomonas marmotae]MBO1075003.1 NAD(P)-dependent oxidoreductase [Roseomonas marmotae]QTI79961.1 NAD(P)-dependent oxidoreductase [Roseomonas marmotae]
MSGGVIRRIGFIGIGNMGWPMAANLLKAGFEVVVADAAPGRAGRFAREVGGGAAADAGDAARGADAVITILPTSRHVAEVVAEIAPALTAGAVVVEMSSGVPGVTRQLAEDLAKLGCAMVDCPVSGGVPRARTGELSIMVGGEDAALARVDPVLRAMGNAIHRCGGIGNAQAMKALNNLVSAGGFLIGVEALLIGQKFGLDPALMVDVLNASTGMNNSTQKKFKQFVLSRRFDSGFGLDLMIKDLSIAMEVGRETGTPTPFAALCRELWSSAGVLLGPGQDHTAVAQLVEQLGGQALGGGNQGGAE